MIRVARAALLALVLAAGAAPAAVRASVAEAWYLARGRANMQIANYAAAIEAYEKALQANPRSREASRALGEARLRNGETDRAVAQFDRHLARFPDDADVAFEQARLLQWSRYAYRAKDAVRYLRAGLAARDDPARRRELARLLARDRATLDDALAEYDRLLARAPGDAELRAERLKLLLWDPRRRGEAIRALEARERERPDDEQARRELARLCAEDAARAAEGADRYAALLARHPDDAALALGHARALARAGRRAEAREAYARAVRLAPTTEVRLERADLLAADPATRDAARAEYEAVLEAAPRSRRARLGLARVLGARRETSPAAISQYQAVLRESPRDPEAHRGLARAYAWTGDSDRALAHAEAAEREARATPDVAELERALRRGREPALGGGVRAVAQSGGAFGLSSVVGLATGSAEPTPFTHSEVEGGVALRRGEGVARSEGTFAAARAEWRPSAGARLALGGGWDGSRLAAHGLSGALRLELLEGERTLSFGVARSAREDSYRALAGEVVAGRAVGAASENVASLRAAWAGASRRLEVAARAGAVTGAGFDPDFTAGAGVRADCALVRRGVWALWAGAAADVTHHARDLSGLADADPLAPRLFSPPLFATASPRLSLVRDAGLSSRLVLDAGPALQLTAGPGGGARLGGDARLALESRVADRLRLSLGARGERISDVHGRLEAFGAAALLF
jgi:tetratricopeptide (TPR) repeat protein